MSMNLFFRAFTQQEVEQIKQDHKLIDKWIEEEKYFLKTDIETAWDVLATILDGAGIYVGEDIEDALFNGCKLISANMVKEQARKLSNWTPEQIVEHLQKLDENDDLYHLDLFQENEEYLLKQFDCLVTFYKEAAEKGLAAVAYLI